MTASENRALTAAGLLSALCAVVAAVLFFGPVPCFDDWILVPLVDQLFDGRVPWQDFWALHNEHRLFFPKIILSFWALWTHWDLHAVAYLELVLLAGATALLARAASDGAQPFWKTPAFWAACVFTLSLRATKVALWPIMLSAYLCSTCVVAAFALIAQKPSSRTRWALAGALCSVATLSFAGGLFSWFAAIPLLWTLRRGRINLTAALIWLFAAAASLTVYFAGYRPAPGHPSIWISLQEPVALIHFFLVFMGSMFEPMPGALFGGIGLILAARLARSAWKSGSPQEAGLTAVTVFVLLNGLATAAARLHFGPMAATSDRYLPISCFFWAALAVHLASRGCDKISRLALFFLVGCVLVMAPGHAQVAYRFKESHRWAEGILKKDAPLRGELEAIYYEPDRLPGYIEILKKRKLSVFR